MRPWMPTAFTPSLTGTEDFVTDGDRLIRIVEKYWKDGDSSGPFRLDDWQKWLLRHVLERYPDDWPDAELAGRLRYRQVVISMGRQNGKSTLGAIFGVYGLYFHEENPRVVSLAYSEKTAEVIYDRVGYFISNTPAFAKVTKVTKVSGIRRTDCMGQYIIKPASEKAIQGFPISMCLYDEVHITPEKLWSAAKQGTKTKKDGLIVGITTAGNEDSTLLKTLYEQGYDAIANQDNPDKQRFGFFLWTSPEGTTIDDDDAIRAANPAVAEGRVSLRTVRSDAQTDAEPEKQRYVLNRMVNTSDATWLPTSLFYASTGADIPQDGSVPLYGSVDVSTSMGYGSIAVSAKVDDVVHVEYVESMIHPNHETLVQRIEHFYDKGIQHWVLDSMYLGKVAEELKARGIPVTVLRTTTAAAAAGVTYGLFASGRLKHDNNELFRMQSPKAVRKPLGNGWAVSRTKSSVEIDAVMALINAAYVAETTQDYGIQLF